MDLTLLFMNFSSNSGYITLHAFSRIIHLLVRVVPSKCSRCERSEAIQGRLLKVRALDCFANARNDAF